MDFKILKRCEPPSPWLGRGRLARVAGFAAGLGTPNSVVDCVVEVVGVVGGLDLPTGVGGLIFVLKGDCPTLIFVPYSG